MKKKIAASPLHGCRHAKGGALAANLTSTAKVGDCAAPTTQTRFQLTLFMTVSPSLDFAAIWANPTKRIASVHEFRSRGERARCWNLARRNREFAALSNRSKLPRERSKQRHLQCKQPIRSSIIAHPSAVGHELVSLSNRRPALNSAPLPQSRRAPTQSRSHLEHTKIVVFAVPTRHMLVASPAAPAPTS